MIRLITIFSALALAIAACVPVDDTGGGNSGVRVYNIRSGDTAKIQFRMLDSVNALRSAAGASQVQLNPNLNAAAATHAKDMSRQNRPWHFGSDGSSPIDRIRRVGYTG